MLLSTQTDNVFAKCGIDEGLNVFAKAGYEALDYSMFGMTNDDHFLNNTDVEAFAKELRGKAEAVGLRFNQAQALCGRCLRRRCLCRLCRRRACRLLRFRLSCVQRKGRQNKGYQKGYV